MVSPFFGTINLRADDMIFIHKEFTSLVIDYQSSAQYSLKGLLYR